MVQAMITTIVPWITWLRPGHSTFWEARRREPEFRAAWDAALANHRARQRSKQRFALSLEEVAA